MDRNVTVRFYQIGQAKDAPIDLEGALRALDARSKRDREFEADEGVTLRLEDLVERDGLLIGDITRVQERNLPGHVVDDDVNKLPVDRIGHSCAFLFDPVSRCMAFQFDIQTGIGRMCRYLAHAAHGTKYSYLPYLKGDTLERFKGQTPRRLKLKVARIRNFAGLGTATTEFEDQIEEWARLYDAPTVEVILSTSGQDNSLDRAQVWNTIRRWIGFKEVMDGIKKIEVETLEADNAFNFIKDLLLEQATLQLPDNNPLGSRAVRQNYVRDCYAQHRAYITRISGDG